MAILNQNYENSASLIHHLKINSETKFHNKKQTKSKTKSENGTTLRHKRGLVT